MGNNSVHGSLKRKRKKSSQSDVGQEVGHSAVDLSVGAMDYYDKRDALAGDLMSSEEIGPEKSDIEEYYKGKNILITGASGFVGTILLEKLLRTMDVNKIYLLFRGKKSQSLDTRLRDYFAEEAFDAVRKQNFNFHKKIVVLAADLQCEGLGLSEEERQVLIDDVQVVFHVAATVKFDEPLNIAYDINCSGTETLLNMAEKMRNLECFVYVSTAYSNCHFKNIEEKFYDAVYTHTEIKQIVDSCSETEFLVLNEVLIKPMPNTYTLTKHANENMCKLRLDRLPLVIVRPSIVMPTLEEPCPGWMKGMNGLVALYVAVGLGLMRTVYQSTENTIDIVPGNVVINCLLAAAWDKGVRHNREKGNVDDVIVKKMTIINNQTNNLVSKKTVQYTQVKTNTGSEIVRESHTNEDERTEKFVDENSNEFCEDNSIDVKDNAANPIYNMISCVENPITLGRTCELILEANRTTQEGCEKSIWVTHHNPTNNKWLYFFYFYVYNLLPTVLFFVFLEKFSGKKAQLMKIYRKIFFLNTTVANFSINEWKFTNGNALSLLERMSAVDKEKYSFSMKKVDWVRFFAMMPRVLARYGVNSYTSKHIYNTRNRYMHMIDFAVLNTVKVLLVYLLYRLICYVFQNYLEAII